MDKSVIVCVKCGHKMLFDKSIATAVEEVAICGHCDGRLRKV